MAKALQFTCPDCGCHNLTTIEQSIEQYPVQSVAMDRNKIEVVYGDDSDLLDHWKSHFACGGCQKELIIIKHNYPVKVQTEQDLKLWFRANPPQ